MNTAQTERNRLAQIKRVLTVATIIKQHQRFILPSMRDIQRELLHRYDLDYCDRTIYRDINGLIELGMIEKSRKGCVTRYRFCGGFTYSEDVRRPEAFAAAKLSIDRKKQLRKKRIVIDRDKARRFLRERGLMQ